MIIQRSNKHNEYQNISNNIHLFAYIEVNKKSQKRHKIPIFLIFISNGYKVSLLQGLQP